MHHKVHSKIALVVRRDEDGLRRYVHLGTGNYNPSTARLYTDLSFFTAHPDFGEDATNFFNLLTGISHFQGAKKFIISPFTTHEAIMTLIKKETENAAAKKPARIIAKMSTPRGSGSDRRALHRFPGGREDRSHHSGHLLPASGRRRA